MKILIFESLQDIPSDKENNMFEFTSLKPLYGYEKKFTISNEEIDIGIYLKHMKINIYDRNHYHKRRKLFLERIL